MAVRRDILLDRLETFCSRCTNPLLPSTIVEVIGFGSFFRGKSNAHDVDLAVRFKMDKTQKDRLFRSHEFLLSLPRRWDIDVATPSEAAEVACKNDEDRQHFAEWADHYTWNQLMANGLAAEFRVGSHEWIARKMLQAGLPGVKVMHFVGDTEALTLHTPVRHVIWTLDNKDVRSNVKKLWDSPSDELFRAELANFDAQLDGTNALIEWHSRVINAVLELKRATKPVDEYSFSVDDVLAPTDQKIWNSQRNWQVFLPSGYTPPDRSDLKGGALLELVEGRRNELKAKQWEAVLWEVALIQAARLKRSKTVVKPKSATDREYIAWAVLANRPRAFWPNDEKTIQAIAAMGFPTDRLTRFVSRNTNKVFYGLRNHHPHDLN